MRAAVVTMVALILGVIPNDQKTKTTSSEKKSLSITAFTSSVRTISHCHWFPGSCDPTGRLVHLSTSVQNTKKRPLTYTYAVSAGTINGQGPAVIWDLNGALIGQHTATVSVKDGKGGLANASLEVRIVECTACDGPRPPCPVVTVECPTEVERGKLLTFVAIVAGGEPYETVSYTWETDPALIMDGQNSKNMTLDTQRVSVEKVTARVSVGGFDPSCTQTVGSCVTTIRQR